MSLGVLVVFLCRAEAGLLAFAHQALQWGFIFVDLWKASDLGIREDVVIPVFVGARDFADDAPFRNRGHPSAGGAAVPIQPLQTPPVFLVSPF